MRSDRYFNTEGVCIPQLHYMVRLDDRLKEIKRLFVDRGKYFVINRGRQYGKTTTLQALAEYLKADYLVLSMDFQAIGTAEYRDEDTFARTFAKVLMNALRSAGSVQKEDEKEQAAGSMPEKEWEKSIDDFVETDKEATLRELFILISLICGRAKKPVVMMIDEVDSAANNQVFLDFLAQLRGHYLNRQNQATFHSVVLANSPWNIAADFDIEMSFSAGQITGMLQEYEADHHTGMNLEEMGREIYQYTTGYPYLVSALCRFLDEKIPGSRGFEDSACVWTKMGLAEAVKLLLKKNTPLFDSMAKQLDAYSELRQIIEEILYQGRQITFSPMEKAVNLGVMFGFLKEENGYVAVANRIFEMALLNMFMTKEALDSEAFRYGQRDRNQFVRNGRLNMELVLEKFVVHFTDIYSGNDDRFVEKYGRKFFLLYLKPVINGVGNYYLEAQTRDAGRTDVVVDYMGEQFVVELKIWHGNEYNEQGEEQPAAYLDYFHLNRGYMLSFNFNKKKEAGVRVVKQGGKEIVEAMV